MTVKTPLNDSKRSSQYAISVEIEKEVKTEIGNFFSLSRLGA
jgi:hypothetical protein